MNCKYWTPRMSTLLEYCSCLYRLKDCVAGGHLHILLDDGNYDDYCIQLCLNDCMSHPKDEESDLGILICKEFLKLSMEQRILFWNVWRHSEDLVNFYCWRVKNYKGCNGCFLLTDYRLEEEEDETN